MNSMLNRSNYGLRLDCDLKTNTIHIAINSYEVLVIQCRSKTDTEALFTYLNNRTTRMVVPNETNYHHSQQIKEIEMREREIERLELMTIPVTPTDAYMSKSVGDSIETNNLTTNQKLLLL